MTLTAAKVTEKTLDATVGVMKRNRALLFGINILAATILIVLYLDFNAFDNKQLSAHLHYLRDIQAKLEQNGVPREIASSRPFNASKLENWALENLSGDKNLPMFNNVSHQLVRLRRLDHELSTVSLPGVQQLPIGIAVPRNDYIPIASVFMVIFYAWLYYSFCQLASLIRGLRVSAGSEWLQGDRGKLGFRDLLESHAIFRKTSGPSSVFIGLLFHLPWIALLITLIFDILSFCSLTRTIGYAMGGQVVSRLVIEAMLLVVLGFIGYHITLADRDVVAACYGEPSSNADAAGDRSTSSP